MQLYWNKKAKVGKLMFIDEIHHVRLLQWISGDKHCAYKPLRLRNGALKVNKDEIQWFGVDYTDLSDPMIGNWKLNFIKNEDAANQFMDVFNALINRLRKTIESPFRFYFTRKSGFGDKLIANDDQKNDAVNREENTVSASTNLNVNDVSSAQSEEPQTTAMSKKKGDDGRSDDDQRPNQTSKRSHNYGDSTPDKSNGSKPETPSLIRLERERLRQTGLRNEQRDLEFARNLQRQIEAEEAQQRQQQQQEDSNTELTAATIENEKPHRQRAGGSSSTLENFGDKKVDISNDKSENTKNVGSNGCTNKSKKEKPQEQAASVASGFDWNSKRVIKEKGSPSILGDSDDGKKKKSKNKSKDRGGWIRGDVAGGFSSVTPRWGNGNAAIDGGFGSFENAHNFNFNVDSTEIEEKPVDAVQTKESETNAAATKNGGKADDEDNMEEVKVVTRTEGDIKVNSFKIVKLYRWGKDVTGDAGWKDRATNTTIDFWQQPNEGKVRVICRESATSKLRMNHWLPASKVCNAQLRAKKFVQWSGFDTTIHAEDKDDNNGFCMFNCKFRNGETAKKFYDLLMQSFENNEKFIGNGHGS